MYALLFGVKPRSEWAVYQYGRTDLHMAAQKGDIKLLRQLFAEGAKAILHYKDEFGNTALHLAAQGYDQLTEQYEERDAKKREVGEENYHLCVKLLLENKSYINEPNNSGDTPLHLAIRVSRQVNIIDALLKSHADPLALTKQRQNIFHLVLSAKKNAAQITEFLLSKGDKFKRLLNQQDLTGQTVLHFLAAKKSFQDKFELLRIFFDNISCDNSINFQAETPLHIAVSLGEPAVVQALVQKTNNINAMSITGETPLHLAVKEAQDAKYYDQIIDILLEAGADIYIKDFQLQAPAAMIAPIPRLNQKIKNRNSNGFDSSLNDGFFSKEQLLSVLQFIVNRQVYLKNNYAVIKKLSFLTTERLSQIEVLRKRYGYLVIPNLAKWSQEFEKNAIELKQLYPDWLFFKLNFLEATTCINNILTELRQRNKMLDEIQSIPEDQKQLLKNEIETKQTSLQDYMQWRDYLSVLMAQFPYVLQRKYLYQCSVKYFADNAEAKIKEIFQEEGWGELNLSIKNTNDNTLPNLRLLNIQRQGASVLNLLESVLKPSVVSRTPGKKSDSIRFLLNDQVNLSEEQESDFDAIIKVEEKIGEELKEEQGIIASELNDLNSSLNKTDKGSKQFLKLQDESKDLMQQQKLLSGISAYKFNHRANLEKFKAHPNLLIFYRLTCLKIEDIFLVYKSLATTLVEPAEAKYAAARSFIEIFGDFAGAFPLIGPAIEKVIKWGPGKIVNKISAIRDHNRAIDIAELATLSEVKKIAGLVALNLTLSFEEQLRKLATPEQEYRWYTGLQKGLDRAKALVFRSRYIPSAKKMVAFAILVVLDALESGEILWNIDDDYHSIANHILAKFYQQVNSNIEAAWDFITDKLNLTTLFDTKQNKLIPSKIFNKPGVKLIDNVTGQTSYYIRKGYSRPEKYGWRLAMAEEKLGNEWISVEKPAICHAPSLDTLFKPVEKQQVGQNNNNNESKIFIPT